MADESTCTALLHAAFSFWGVSTAFIMVALVTANYFQMKDKKMEGWMQSWFGTHIYAVKVFSVASVVAYCVSFALFVPSQIHNGTKDTPCSYTGMWDQYNNGTRYDTPNLATSQESAALVVLIPLQLSLFLQTALMFNNFGSVYLPKFIFGDLKDT